MIYPIDEQLERLWESFVDQETGEIIVSEEDMISAITKAQMDFDVLIEQLRNDCINQTAMYEALKGEKQKIEKRQRAALNYAEHDKRFLAYLLKGEKYKKGVVDIGFRASDKLVIDDEEKLRDWAKQNGPGFLKEPELREGDIKTALKNGTDVPFAHIEKRKNIQVK
jgi:hypothetical protein